MWILEAIAQDAPHTFVLPAGNFLVGRKDEPATHIVILNDKAISREHARIVIEPLAAESDSTAVAQATLIGVLRHHVFAVAIAHQIPPSLRLHTVCHQ